ncbi:MULTISPECIES: universal stress protein [unclassified Streptomyces]|uniref:universal stress protein n=1 Tax=unclassified Streptomyces TaxID=2593676 RepID=UPI000DC756B1|nr:MULTISPECIES: universal stress protein [unclassified Streptomyces]AWZ03475.1 universal stress protein [Streptomyces sp. ICC4]AWZ11251.1 universal stress protein [Streptomyces sp. ICC1]
MNDRILVGLDGSAESIAAAHWAAREALLRGVPLHLVHAEEWSTPFDIPVATDDVRRHWSQALLNEAADELRTRHRELEVDIRSFDGKPAAMLAAVAAGASMIVLGSRGLGTVTGFVLGSVGMAVIQATVRPVVMVRASEDTAPHPDGRHAPRDVVVGVDIGGPCDALLAFAFEEAARRACALRVRHSWSMPPLVGYGAAYDPRVHAQLEMSAKASMEDVLKPWRDKYPAVDVTSRASAGHASTELLDGGSEAGLIVVGRRIRRSSIGTHIGPVTHAVLHHAKAPVAVIAHE